MKYVTKSELRAYSSVINEGQRTSIRKTAANRAPDRATFLSHSTKDDDLVVGANRILEAEGAQVYIDKIDPAMPPYTTKETAKLLKDRIGVSHRFILLASENSKESKWVPWELGIADGSKSATRIALFPAVDSEADNAWTSREYLGLYDRIIWGRITGQKKDTWIVYNAERHTARTLRAWLAS